MPEIKEITVSDTDDTLRRMRSTIAANSRWALEPNRAAATAPGREAFMNRFERQVDPDNKLDQAERARRAESAKKAYFTSLALKSAKARRAREAADGLTIAAAVEVAGAVADLDDPEVA